MIKYEKSHGGREKYYSVKYKNQDVGDCVIRAIAHGTGLDYKKVYTDLFKLAMDNGLCLIPKETMSSIFSQSVGKRISL